MIALVNPPVALDHDGRRLQPLGIAYIAAVLDSAGLACDMIDGNAPSPPMSVGSIVSALSRANYSIVGISVTTFALKKAVRIAEQIKKHKPVYVVFGGHHPTALHEEVLREYKCVDAVVRGEGEFSFLELAQAILQSRSATGIQGVTFREPDGSIVVNPERPSVYDLDQLPFPRRQGLVRSYSSVYEPSDRLELFNVPISSSRGCPYHCSFCAARIFYGSGSSAKWRPRSPEHIAGELQEILKVERDIFVRFVDDNFLVDRARALAIARKMVDLQNKPIRFSFAARADQLVRAGAEVLRTLAELGCVSVELGIESGSDAMLSRLAKGTTSEMNTGALRLLRGCGIIPGVDYIMFDPWTSLDELRDSFGFLKDNKLYGYYPPRLYVRVVPFPGTPVAEEHDVDMGNYFRSPDVGIIYHIMDTFSKTWQPRIDGVLQNLDEEVLRSTSDMTLLLDRTILLLKPYQLFEELIHEGHPRSHSICDTGTVRELEKEITRIERKYLSA